MDVVALSGFLGTEDSCGYSQPMAAYFAWVPSPEPSESPEPLPEEIRREFNKVSLLRRLSQMQTCQPANIQNVSPLFQCYIEAQKGATNRDPAQASVLPLVLTP